MERMDVRASATANRDHPARLRYDFKSKDTSYNSKSHGKGHFTKSRQDVDVIDHMLSGKTANTLQNALTNFQEGIDSLALPIVGSLKGKTGGGLRKFIVNLGNQIRGVNTPTPARLGQIITDEINDAIGKILPMCLRMDGTETVEIDNFADDYDVPNIPLDAIRDPRPWTPKSRTSMQTSPTRQTLPSGSPVMASPTRYGVRPKQVGRELPLELSDDFKLSGGLGSATGGS